MNHYQNNVKKILYIRSAPYVLKFDSYNLQEVGLGVAFCKHGYDFDLIYYSKDNRDQTINVGDRRIKILWRKGIKLLRTGIYPFSLNKKFLNQYNIVIVSEYNQIMSHLIGKRHKNVYLYNGPYYNLFKIPFIEPIYDKLFCKKINKEMKKVFCKTQMAADYIAHKGITNTIVTGVGLDISKFEQENEIVPETMSLLNRMQGKRNILYIGSIIPRKNVELLLRTFNILKSMDNTSDVQFVIVGKGKPEYVNYCKNIASNKIIADIIWVDSISNAQTKFIYRAAEIFMLASIQEIFGMVLLEAMYNGLAVISSKSAGGQTLINNNINGILINEYNENVWAQKIYDLLQNKQMIEFLGKNARKTISEHFLWDKIVDTMLLEIDDC